MIRPRVVQFEHPIHFLQKVVYKIDNLPKCTDIKDAATVKRLIDNAAKTWNEVEGANVMWVRD